VLARLLGFLEHDFLGAEAQLSDLFVISLNSDDSVKTMLMPITIDDGDPSLINGDSSPSSRSMSSSEVVSAGALVFFFTLHSCLVGITSRIVLKCSSISFLAASSHNFYALICWILLL
jgi:hypothetical protein